MRIHRLHRFLMKSNRKSERKKKEMAKELLKRSEVRVEDTWKVEDMYANVDAWKADLEEVKKLAEELTTYQGRVGESAETLYRVAFLDDEIGRIGSKAFSYDGRDTGHFGA